MERPTNRWEDNIKMDLHYKPQKGMYWIDLAQDHSVSELWWTKYQGSRFSFPKYFGFFLSVPYSHCSKHVAISKRAKGRRLGTFLKPAVFRKSGSSG
jgi:hypothetical protein